MRFISRPQKKLSQIVVVSLSICVMGICAVAAPEINVDEAVDGVEAGANIISQEAKSLAISKLWQKTKRALGFEGKDEVPATDPGPGLSLAAQTAAKNAAEKFRDVIAEETGGVVQDFYVMSKSGDLPPTLGRDVELENLRVALQSSYTKSGVLLHGPSGAGRSQILYGLQQQIVDGDIPTIATNTRLLEVDISQISGLSDLEAHLDTILKLVNENKLDALSAKNEKPAVGFILDDIRKLARREKEAPPEMTMEKIKAAIRKRFGANTMTITVAPGNDEKALAQTFPFLDSSWAMVNVSEMTPEQSFGALRQFVTNTIEKENHFSVEDSVLQKADEWCRRYYPSLAQPGCSARLLVHAVARKNDILKQGKPAILAVDLRAQKDKLLAEKNRFQGNTRTYAQQRLASIDSDVADLDTRINDIEKHTLAVSALTQRLQSESTRIASLNSEIARLENALVQHPEQKTALLSDIEKAKADLAAAEDAQTKITAEGRTLNEGDLALAIHRETGTPYTEIFAQKQALSFEQFWKKFRDNFIGQEHLEPLLREIYYSKNNIDRGPDEPAIKILIIGDRGTGKSWFANLMARLLSDGALVKLEGGKMQQAHTISLVHGSPPGYIGYDEGSPFLNQIRRKLKCTILIDEVDKMNPEIYNDAFLEATAPRTGGKLSDGAGREVSLGQVDAWIETANWGQNEIKVDWSQQQIRDYLLAKGYITEAKMSRIQHIVVFNTFNEKERAQIVNLNLEGLKTGYATKYIGFDYDPEVTGYLAGKLPTGGSGIDARQIDTVVSSEIRSRMAEIIQDGRYIDANGKIIKLKVEEGDEVFASVDPDQGLVFSVR